MNSAKSGNYEIRIADSGSVEITLDGEKVSSAIKALREIAEQEKFEYDEGWNTRTFGKKMVEFLNSKNTGDAEPVETKVEAKEETEEEPEEDPLKPEDVEASSMESASSKIRVYGKAQNRTALGIVHAYMVMYPHATLEDLKKAFPDSLNPDSGVKKNFVYVSEVSEDANWKGFFLNEDELITTGDGKKVALVSMWTKKSFLNMVAQAKVYDIVVAKFEAADKGGKKGGFYLEYLNGYVPPVPSAPAKKKPWWLWLIIAIVILLLVFLLFKATERPKVVEKEKIVHVVDTVYIQQLEEIEKNFNAAQFEQGKAELVEEAKFVLHDLQELMEKHPEVRLKIVGHTSAEGAVEYNQQLSENRAKAAVDFLVSRGIDISRLEYEGKGSSEPLDVNRPEINRRTEFIVLD